MIDVNVMVNDWTVKCSPGDQTSREVKPTPLSFSRKPLTRPFLFLFLRISLQKFHFNFRTPFKNFISHQVFPLKKVFLCSLIPINFHRWHKAVHATEVTTKRQRYGIGGQHNFFLNYFKESHSINEVVLCFQTMLSLK